MTSRIGGGGTTHAKRPVNEKKSNPRARATGSESERPGGPAGNTEQVLSASISSSCCLHDQFDSMTTKNTGWRRSWRRGMLEMRKCWTSTRTMAGRGKPRRLGSCRVVTGRTVSRSAAGVVQKGAIVWIVKTLTINWLVDAGERGFMSARTLLEQTQGRTPAAGRSAPDRS
jgi:hypothetical protein